MRFRKKSKLKMKIYTYFFLLTIHLCGKMVINNKPKNKFFLSKKSRMKISLTHNKTFNLHFSKFFRPLKNERRQTSKV